jgi:hypothetical protein
MRKCVQKSPARQSSATTTPEHSSKMGGSTAVPFSAAAIVNGISRTYPPCAFGFTREIVYATVVGVAGLGVFKVRHVPNKHAEEAQHWWGLFRRWLAMNGSGRLCFHLHYPRTPHDGLLQPAGRNSRLTPNPGFTGTFLRSQGAKSLGAQLLLPRPSSSAVQSATPAVQPAGETLCIAGCEVCAAVDTGTRTLAPCVAIQHMA